MTTSNKKIERGGQVCVERVIFLRKEGKLRAKLLYAPEEILSVCNALTGECVRRDTFTAEGNILSALSTVAFLEEDWLTCKNLPEGLVNLGEEYGISDVFLFEPRFLAEHSYEVAYRASEKALPEYAYGSSKLTSLLKAARKKKKLCITLLGDSISNAANSSGEGRFPPYAKAWYEEGCEGARAYYGDTEICFSNRSRSGCGTEWAITVAESIWEETEDDLFIVAFGMNDASASLPTKKYIENIRYLLEKRKNKDGAFVLIASILPNPDSALYYGELRKEYQLALRALCKELGGGFIDMTALSEALMQRKDYVSLSGNNFNHPNDYVYRFYAEALRRLLTEETENL